MEELRSSMNFKGPTFLYNSTDDFPNAQRVRVFAGPNGSGKSTVIASVREATQNGRRIDFGHYINADDIAQELRLTGRLSMEDCWMPGMSKTMVVELSEYAGFLAGAFTRELLELAVDVKKPHLLLLRLEFAEEVAQLIADLKRRLFLTARSKFSFETVFSHPSKVEFLRQANASRYKVYLYFVGTESPEINVYRVASRVQANGHNVPAEKIVNRYYRAMNLMWAASQYAYQAYFFDNSVDDQAVNLFAHFKVVDGKKMWDVSPTENVPTWFKKHYSRDSLEFFSHVPFP